MPLQMPVEAKVQCPTARVEVLVKKGSSGESSLRGRRPLQSRVSVPSGDGLTDSLSAVCRAALSSSMGKISSRGLGEASGQPDQRRVTVAFQHLLVSGRPEDVEGKRRGVAAGVLCHLSELRQHLDGSSARPPIGIQHRHRRCPFCCVGKCAPNNDGRVRFLNRFGPLHHGFELDQFAVECRSRLRRDLLHRLDPLTHQLEAGCKRSAVMAISSSFQPPPTPK